MFICQGNRSKRKNLISASGQTTNKGGTKLKSNRDMLWPSYFFLSTDISLKSRKMDPFPERLVPGFGLNLKLFQPFFLGKIVLKTVLCAFLISRYLPDY